MSDIILIGGGGHCKSCIDVIESTGLYRIVGILDLPEFIGQKVLEYPIVGTDQDLGLYVEKKTSFMITIGQLSEGPNIRDSLFEKIYSLGGYLPSIFSTSSKISNHSKIGIGSVFLTNTFVNAGSVVGDNCIINSGAIIEHDATIGNHCHISTGVLVNGEVTIGNSCFIASGVVLRNGISIVDNVMIGMGSIVTRNICEPGVYLGNPIRKVR